MKWEKSNQITPPDFQSVTPFFGGGDVLMTKKLFNNYTSQEGKTCLTFKLQIEHLSPASCALMEGRRSTSLMTNNDQEENQKKTRLPGHVG